MTASPALAVIKREFLSGLRSPKPFLFLAVVMLIMIAALVFLFGVVLESRTRYGGPVSARDVRSFFLLFSFGLYFSAMLLVPPMAAVSICVEKQQDSYDLLRMTYISPFALAMAKLFNVLGIYTLVAIATLPLVGVFFFLVGIDWPQFVQSGLIIALSALSAAIIGLACSAKFYRTLPAIMTTYAVGFMLQGGLFLLLVVLTEVLWPYTWISSFFNRYGEELATTLCPMFSLVVLAEGRMSIVSLAAILIYQAAILFLGLRITLAILRRPTEPMKVDQEKPIDDQAVLQARRKSFPYYLIDPRRRRAMIPDGANPLYHKELQTGLLGKGTFSVRIFYGFTIFCLVVSIISVVGGDFGIRNIGAFVGWPVLIDTIIILVLTPSLVAMAMSKEYEWGNLDMLRMTLLEPGQIINGKFRTGVYTALIPIAAALLGSIPLGMFGWHSGEAWAAAISGFGTMIVSVLYVLALTLAVTATCRRGITALLLGYGASIGALVLLPLGLFIITLAFRSYTRNYQVIGDLEEAVISFVSPLAAQFRNLENADYYNSTSLFNAYWVANTLFFLVITPVIFRIAGVRLARRLHQRVD